MLLEVDNKINEEMNGNIISLIMVVIVFSSCNTTTEKKNGNVEESNTTEKKEVNVDERFVGAWKLIAMLPDKNPNDHSLDGIICHLEKYQNTNKTFVFHLFTGNDLVLSIQDESNLVGENANMKVKFDDTTNKLILTIPGSNTTFVFKKLE